jgi:aminopeptidase N
MAQVALTPPKTKMWKINFACLLALAVSIARAPADNYPRQPGLEPVHYAFHLTVSDDTNEIVGLATVDFRFLQAGLTNFSLDLTSTNGTQGMTVSAVTSSNAPIPYLHQTNHLILTLDPPSQAGELRRFSITYRGVPARNPAGFGVVTNKFGERTMSSVNFHNGARQWLPLIDHPSAKATSEFFITAPAHYQVIANGLLQEETDLGDGTRLTHWKQSVPIAPWLNAIQLAQFAVDHAGDVRGIPLQTWVYHQDRDVGYPGFEEPARQSVEFFSDYIGPFPYEKLANVETAGLGGGTEHASAIAYGERSVNNRIAPTLVAHEISHQWFGDSITERDWNDIWLAEGFATYFTLLFTEHYEGRDAFVAGLKRSRDSIFTMERRPPVASVIQEVASEQRGPLNQIVYQKGAWTLHMLRGLLGPAKFQAGIREYYRRYRDHNASTDDFRKVMEETSGLELSWFFEQWLRRPGSPALQGGWTYDPDKKQIEIDLAQTQPGPPYRLNLEIGLTTSTNSAASKIEKIELTGGKQHFQITAPTEPTTVTLDPNTWTLATMQFNRITEEKKPDPAPVPK